MQEYVFDYTSYKKKLKKPVNFSFSLTIVVCILLLGLTFFLNQKRTDLQFYFVQVGEFENFSNANVLANEIVSQNGAGFVYFDGCYHVLAGFYLNNLDAENVAKNISPNYPNTKVFSITQQKFVYNKNYNKTQNEMFLKMFETLSEIEKDLYNLSVLVDTNAINQTKASTKITSMIDIFATVSTDFSTHFRDDYSMINEKKAIKEIETSLNRLKGTTEQELPQKLKYELIDIVINHTKLLNNLA